MDGFHSPFCCFKTPEPSKNNRHFKEEALWCNEELDQAVLTESG